MLFFFHGGRGNAANCGGRPDIDNHRMLSSYMLRLGSFALICPEARQYQAGDGPPGHALPPPGSDRAGGLWDIPDFIGNSSTGNRCTGTKDLDYMDAVIEELAKQPEVYDVSRLFMSGCSMGSAFSSFAAICNHQKHRSITAWATHSTGISINGLPALPQVPSSEPFWPIVPVSTVGAPLKACIFDNHDDQIPDPGGSGKIIRVFNSSQKLAQAWTASGNRVETGFSTTGGHCGFHDYMVILKCLDDGTGRLLSPSAVQLSPRALELV